MTLRKLEKQELMAERQVLVSLLEESRVSEDIVGEMQFERKLAEVEEALAQLEEVGDTRAAVALFFGGPKVVGTQGIQADFAGEILEDFQDLVSKTFARNELGALGARGPVPVRANTNLMVTNVTRGSFGFVLEEINDQGEAFDTELSEAVDHVAELIEVVAGPEEEPFSERVAEMDSRMITSVRNFFAALSKAKATLRLVERDREVLLDRPKIERGRERTESLEVEEQEGQLLTGVLLGLLPKHKRFEFVLDGGETISGSVVTDASREIGDQLLIGALNPVGKKWIADFTIKDVKRHGRPTRRYYTLVSLVREAQ